jgi:tetratricopeptide (TPR) repeat protein
MVVTLQYVNRPEEVDSIFKSVSMEGMNMESCTQCKYRIYTQALANIELKKYIESINLLKPLTDVMDDLYLQRALFAAYIRSRKFSELESQLERLKLSNSSDYMQNALSFIAKEFLLLNNSEKAREYYERIISLQDDGQENSAVSQALYYMNEYSRAEPLFEELHRKDPLDVTTMARLAVCYHKNSKVNKAQELLEKINATRSDYQFGSVDYAIAQYNSRIGNKSKSLQHLLKSVADGNIYTLTTFQNDPHFLTYLDDPGFNEIMTFWH